MRGISGYLKCFIYIASVKHLHTETINKYEKRLLRSFIKDVSYRVKLGSEMAVFSWRNGVSPYDSAQDEALVRRAEELAAKNSISTKEASLIAHDINKAANAYTAVMLVNWYAESYYQDVVCPFDFEDKNLTDINVLKEEFQDKVIMNIKNFTKIKNMPLCSNAVADQLFRVKEIPNIPLRMATQRAMVRFCNVLPQDPESACNEYYV